MAKQMVCGSCGSVVVPVRETKGSFFIELFLWLCFLFPGLIYSIWRLTSKYDACPTCKAANLVPLDSPMGRKLVGETQKT